MGIKCENQGKVTRNYWVGATHEGCCYIKKFFVFSAFLCQSVLLLFMCSLTTDSFLAACALTLKSAPCFSTPSQPCFQTRLLEGFNSTLSFPRKLFVFASTHPSSATFASVPGEMIAKSAGTAPKVVSGAPCQPWHLPTPCSLGLSTSLLAILAGSPGFSRFLHFMSYHHTFSVSQIPLCIVPPSITLPGSPRLSAASIPIVVLFPTVLLEPS